jgi:conjugative transfer signal peptidase TraF
MQPGRWLGWLRGGVAGGVVCLAWLALQGRPPVVLNLSASLPRGLYRVQPATQIHPGMIAVVQPRPALALVLSERHALPLGVPLLKPVAAVVGDTVCVDTAVRVNGTVLTTVIADADSQGRPLPHWHGCLTLGPADVFLLSTYSDRSLDSRYVGPVPRETVVGTATLIWRW